MYEVTQITSNKDKTGFQVSLRDSTGTTWMSAYELDHLLKLFVSGVLKLAPDFSDQYYITLYQNSQTARNTYKLDDYRSNLNYSEEAKQSKQKAFDKALENAIFLTKKLSEGLQ